MVEQGDFSNSLVFRSLALLGVHIPFLEDGTVDKAGLHHVPEFRLADVQAIGWLAGFESSSLWPELRRELRVAGEVRDFTPPPPLAPAPEVEAEVPADVQQLRPVSNLPSMPYVSASAREISTRAPNTKLSDSSLGFVWRPGEPGRFPTPLLVRGVRNAETGSAMRWRWFAEDNGLLLEASDAVVDCHVFAPFLDLSAGLRDAATYGFAAHLALPLSGSRSLADHLSQGFGVRVARLRRSYGSVQASALRAVQGPFERAFFGEASGGVRLGNAGDE